MQVDDGGTSLDSIDSLLGDLFRCDRQIFRHGRGVHCTGNGTGDDNFAVLIVHRFYSAWDVPGDLAATDSMSRIANC
ncbi:hypothetical protein D3C79_834040 [compost metagenome]